MDWKYQEGKDSNSRAGYSCKSLGSLQAWNQEYTVSVWRWQSRSGIERQLISYQLDSPLWCWNGKRMGSSFLDPFGKKVDDGWESVLSEFFCTQSQGM